MEFPAATARWAEEGEAQGRHCNASPGENLSWVSQRFVEKTPQRREAHLLSLNSASSYGVAHSSVSQATGSRQPPPEGVLPLQHVWCMKHSPCDPSLQPGDQWMFRLLWKEDRVTAPLAGLCAAQDESRLDGNVSWGPHRRKSRVSKQGGEQISLTYCLLSGSLLTCVCACTVRSPSSAVTLSSVLFGVSHSF